MEESGPVIAHAPLGRPTVLITAVLLHVSVG
jgi:hypothetical protein